MTDHRLDPQSWRQRLRETEGASDLRAHAEEITRQSRERWDQLQEVHVAMRAVRETAVSPRREVSVTAVWGGSIAEVSFPTAAYKRLPIAEFASIVQATVAAAQQKVTASVSVLLAPTLPPGVDAQALLAGNVDLTTLVPTEPEDWFMSADHLVDDLDDGFGR